MANRSNRLTDTVKRPEDELILCCARTVIDSAAAARIQTLLQGSVNWEYLIRAASKQGVKPLFCTALSKTCPDYVPKPILEQLQRYLQAHSLKNLFMLRELIKVLRQLENTGISAIPYKGPVLAVAAYGDVAFRQFGDLDILVREKDALKARDLILASGYRTLYQGSAEQEEAFHGLRQVCEMVREDGRVVVELHWAITSETFYFPLDPNSLWEKVEPVSLEGTLVPNLGPEDLLLVLCVHGAKHHWTKLMWICDIAELIRANAKKINWSRLMDRASSLGGGRMLLLGLMLARDLLGANIPVEALKQSRGESKLNLLAAEVRSALFSGDSPMAVDRPNFYIQLRERAQDRIRCRLYLAYLKLSPNAQGWMRRLVHTGRSVLGSSRHP